MNKKIVILLLPAAIFFGLFVFWPLLYTFYLSFFDWNMISPKKTFVGLDNYIAIFKDPITYKVLGIHFYLF
ncbi:hypothetical protein ACI2OX_18185 [Bacillus sp. N9]